MSIDRRKGGQRKLTKIFAFLLTIIKTITTFRSLYTFYFFSEHYNNNKDDDNINRIKWVERNVRISSKVELYN